GPLQHGTGDRQLLALRLRQARAAGADRIAEPDLDQSPAQAELVEHFGHRGVDALAAARLAADNGAEKDIFLHRSGRIVAPRVEELDGAPQILRQTGGESAPRRENPLLHLL